MATGSTRFLLGVLCYVLTVGACCPSASSPKPHPLPPQAAHAPPLAMTSPDDRSPLTIPATSSLVAVMGRVDYPREGVVRFGYPGVTLRITFEGESVGLRASSYAEESRLTVVVDGIVVGTVRLDAGESELSLARNLGTGKHTIDIVHRTETWQSIVEVASFTLPANATVHRPQPWPKRKLLFIGDSVTCGEGVDRSSKTEGYAAAGADAYHSYGMRLARALDAQCQLVCYGGRGLIRSWEGKTDVANAPRLFDLALAGDEIQSPWEHQRYVPDLVFVSLGTNDFSLGLGPLPEREPFVSAYVDFVRVIRAHFPRAKVVLTEGAIVNDSADPARPQKTVLRRYIVATVERLRDANVVFIPSEYYPGDAKNAHPTGEQHKAIVADLAPRLAKLMGW